MIKIKFTLSFLFLVKFCFAQHQYYKVVNPQIIEQFKDTTSKINFIPLDSVQSYKAMINYTLRFYPNLLFKNLTVYTKPSQKVAKLKPAFFSIFKAPQHRHYKLYFSNSTGTLQDSVLLNSLTYNSKIGLIARQMSHLQDLSTTHFFGFISWYFKQLSRKAKTKLEYDAELKTLEMGLGYQLLSLAKENNEKLKIEKWNNTAGYGNYVKQTQGKYMNPETILNFVRDLPIYVSQQYK